MNVWEAYQHLKAGSVIKVNQGCDEEIVTTYIFRTVEEPIGVIRFKTVEKDTLSAGHRPEALKDLDWDSLEHVCIAAFDLESYEHMTLEEFLEEAQKLWDAVNDE